MSDALRPGLTYFPRRGGFPWRRVCSIAEGVVRYEKVPTMGELRECSIDNFQAWRMKGTASIDLLEFLDWAAGLGWEISMQVSDEEGYTVTLDAPDIGKFCAAQGVSKTALPLALARTMNNYYETYWEG